ncbi:FISUMP domain-containing protein [Fulvivirga lutimaris]|uniref:FISUMP domain-containing protein n=1 Tax=Fulvivirga lutimaris TaxID=1819566 RepID=UPI0012BC5618|nr:FISUMP domain-containing protein [Fulvivirga lutimaris]MTI38595.1 hypothetical protein [Fulvivirga lutimaris]
MKKCLLLILAIQTSVFTDNRDQSTYQEVKIEGQTWLKENLKYIYKDGAGASYKIEPYYEKYGAYYTSSSSKDACPEGYHLPSLSEWKKYIETIPGKVNNRGGKLVSTKQLESNALTLGGMVRMENVMMNDIMGYYWTSTDTLKTYYKTPDDGLKKHLIGIHIWSSGEKDSINIEPTYMLAAAYEDKIGLNCKCVKD